jgi:hypothetical protein
MLSQLLLEFAPGHHAVIWFIELSRFPAQAVNFFI